MKTVMRALAIVPMVAVMAAMIPRSDAVMKCGSQSPNGLLFAIDGLITAPKDGVSPLKSLAQENVYSLAVLCMDPVDSTFNYTRGWQLISVWTMQGPAPRLKDALNLIRDAQDAHFAKHGKYITSLDQITLPETLKPLRITLKGDAKGWIASATVPRLLSTCSMFDGTIATPLYIGPRHIDCASDPR
jgi:hypothetical protein